MNNRKLMLENLRDVASKMARTPTRDEYHRDGKGKFTEYAIRKEFGSWPEFIQAAGLIEKKEKITDPAGLAMAKMREEVRRLKAYNEELESKVLSEHKIIEMIGSIDASNIAGDAEWLRGATDRKESCTGIPVLFLSDLHYDEVVKKDQVSGVNEYNRKIADERLKHTFKTAIRLLMHNMTSPKYDGIVCALGGDMFSGYIHEELRETNENPIMISLFALADILAAGIGELADEFGKVFVPCVVGNHSRIDRKPRMKNRVFDNFEFTLYQTLVRFFANDDRVSFLVPHSADAYFSVYGKNICLTHGDQFRGGEGVGGIMVPIMRGITKKQSRQSAIRKPFELTMMGHWHQYIHTQNLVINGSVKGYDEFAYMMNFGFERPQQACFVIHPEKDVTFRMPILCDSYEKSTEIWTPSKPKIEW